MYNNMFTRSLTAAESKLLQATLNLYEELTLDSCGDVNILGIPVRTDETDAEFDARVKQEVYGMSLCIEHRVAMSDKRCESVWGMLQDAIDQFDVTNGECGALDDEDDRRMACHICELIRK